MSRTYVASIVGFYLAFGYENLAIPQPLHQLHHHMFILTQMTDLFILQIILFQRLAYLLIIILEKTFFVVFGGAYDIFD